MSVLRSDLPSLPTPSSPSAITSRFDARAAATSSSGELSIEAADAVIRQLLAAGLALRSTASSRSRRAAPNGPIVGPIVDLRVDTLEEAACTVDQVIRQIRRAVFDAVAAGSSAATVQSEPDARTTLRDTSARLTVTWLSSDSTEASPVLDHRIAQAVRLLRNAERLMDPTYLWA